MGFHVSCHKMSPWDFAAEQTTDLMQQVLNLFSRQGLIPPKQEIELWQGLPIQALGGIKVEPIPASTSSLTIVQRIKMFRDKNPRKFWDEDRVYFTLKVEGEIRLQVGLDEHANVPFILATMEEPNMRNVYGDVYFEVFTYYGRTFNDYFVGEQQWYETNQKILLELLTRLKGNKYVSRIDVGDSLECKHKGTESIYTYRRRDDDVFSTIITLSQELSRDGEFYPDFLSRDELQVIHKQIAPYRRQTLYSILNKAQMMQTHITPLLRQTNAIIEAGSFTLYNPHFKVLKPQYIALLNLFSRLFAEGLPPRSEIKERIMKALDANRPR